jgi:hypothetical protein
MRTGARLTRLTSGKNMSEFFTKLFSSDFMPHGYCYLWNPGIVWLHAVSDGAELEGWKPYGVR